jgi:hypothetical protein
MVFKNYLNIPHFFIEGYKFWGNVPLPTIKITQIPAESDQYL